MMTVTGKRERGSSQTLEKWWSQTLEKKTAQSRVVGMGVGVGVEGVVVEPVATPAVFLSIVLTPHEV